MNYNNKKEIFSELRDLLYFTFTEKLDGVNLFSLINSKQIIEEIKKLQVIEIDDLENFLSYVNYDHFLIFKCDESYYFCDTQLVPSLNLHSMIKLLDFNQHLRKDKISKINKE